jgi:hypothetical protein
MKLGAAALALSIATMATWARADAPVTLSLDPGACTTSIDAVVLAGHVALEAPVDVVPSAEARVRATWAEPPCETGRVRVVLRDASGAVLAGPVDLSTAGLSARLQARVVALWIGEAVRTLATSTPVEPPPKQPVIEPPHTIKIVAPPPQPSPPPPESPPPPPPPPRTRTRLARVALIGSFGYAPSTTSSVAGAMTALGLRLFGARSFLVQLDAGASAVWTPFNTDLGLLTGGVALLLPFALHPNVSLEIGLRATMSGVALLRATGGVEAKGDHILTGGGGVVRALVHDGRFGSMVEVELGGPFGGYAVHVSTAPESDTIVFDGMRVDVRAGVTFE